MEKINWIKKKEDFKKKDYVANGIYVWAKLSRTQEGDWEGLFTVEAMDGFTRYVIFNTDHTVRRVINGIYEDEKQDVTSQIVLYGATRKEVVEKINSLYRQIIKERKKLKENAGEEGIYILYPQ